MFAKRNMLAAASVMALCVAGLSPAAANARVPKPYKFAVQIGPKTPQFVAPAGTGGTWTPLTSPFPGANGADTPLQLTDGTVIVHDLCSVNWYKLTPDVNGSYVNGTWSHIGVMPKGYEPLYFASQVLADGRVIVNGGEYNSGCTEKWTNKGAIYNPVTNKWTDVPPPSGWTSIGDAQSVVLPNGGYMLANALTSQQVIGTFNAAGAPTWTATGSGQADRNDEEGWTMLPLNMIGVVETNANLGGSTNSTELYDIASGTWSHGNATASALVDPIAHEVGPAVLLPTGKVFQVGANSCGHSTCAGFSNVHDPLADKWTKGPDLPKIKGAFYTANDAPAALLPGGHVLVQLSPSFGSTFGKPSHFFEYDGKKLTQVSEPADAPNLASYESRMMVLPTGEILWTSDLNDVAVYASPAKPVAAWAPTISSAPSTVAQGKANYQISGTQFNGLTQGSGYGDDAQSYTNFPLVRIVNNKTGHVCYARTHDHSTMGINDPGEATSTSFDVPKCETGASTLVVVANGMASAPVAVTVTGKK